MTANSQEAGCRQLTGRSYQSTSHFTVSTANIAMPKVVQIKLQDKDIELPVIVGSEGEHGIDISPLRDSTGYITYDPGFGNTGSCYSDITYIDGDKGVLRYRGIPIEQFEQSPNFAEVCWLLIFGQLPSQSDYDRFSGMLTNNAMLDESMKHHFAGFPKQAPLMAILSAMINTLSCFHPELQEPENDDEFELSAAKLISKIRTIAAFAYRSSIGTPYSYPDPSKPYVTNFLHMMFSNPYAPYECDEAVKRAFNLLLILHADHEQNCSTSTVRMVGSSGANLYASCAAGVCALWGPLHGGANVAVLDMLEQIHSGGLTAAEYVKLAKDKTNNIRLMGFGHRVYKNFDPRAKLLQDVAEKLLAYLGKNDPLLQIARELEEMALSDPYFVDRKLYPNVDFYSGIILRAIGIPTSMFTVIFAIGRMPGWIAHWREQTLQPGKISRPRQIYAGPTITNYRPIDQRS